MVELQDMLYVPSFDSNLISVRKITQKGYKVVFTEKDCRIRSGRRTIAIGRECRNNVYKMVTTEAAYLSATENLHNEYCQHQQHRRFDHRDIDAMKKLENKGLASGISIRDCEIRTRCDCCVKGKLARKPFPQTSESKTTATLDLIHTDIWGPMEMETPDKKRYIFTIIDDYSRLV